MEPQLLDLLLPEHSYLFGFLQGDGTLRKQKQRLNDGRGSLSVELCEQDGPLLEAFQSMLSCPSSLKPRQRDTNFKEAYRSVVWTLHHQPLRLQLEELGIPVGRKSVIVKPPVVPHVEDDYWRGLIDADGSVAISELSRPFVSLVTSSDHIALAYLNYVLAVTGFRKTTSRNERDDVYNIVVFDEDSQALARRLYYPGALALMRKAQGSVDVAAWTRPVDRLKSSVMMRWLPHEDELVLSLGPEAVLPMLEGRKLINVAVRYQQLKSGRVKPKDRGQILYAGMDVDRL